MISKEEMYDFASQIAGISDSDLQQYKCGGKTKKKACGGNMKPKKEACGGKTKKMEKGDKTDANDNAAVKPGEKVDPYLKKSLEAQKSDKNLSDKPKQSFIGKTKDTTKKVFNAVNTAKKLIKK